MAVIQEAEWSLARCLAVSFSKTEALTATDEEVGALHKLHSFLSCEWSSNLQGPTMGQGQGQREKDDEDGWAHVRHWLEVIFQSVIWIHTCVKLSFVSRDIPGYSFFVWIYNMPHSVCYIDGMFLFWS